MNDLHSTLGRPMTGLHVFGLCVSTLLLLPAAGFLLLAGAVAGSLSMSSGSSQGTEIVTLAGMATFGLWIVTIVFWARGRSAMAVGGTCAALVVAIIGLAAASS